MVRVMVDMHVAIYPKKFNMEVQSKEKTSHMGHCVDEQGNRRPFLSQDGVYKLAAKDTLLTLDNQNGIGDKATGISSTRGCGCRPSQKPGNCEARSAIYATAAVPIFDHVFLLFLGGFRFQIVSMAFLGP